jgi:hypothetical protein
LLPGASLGSVIERLALNPSASAAGMSVLSQSGSRGWGSEGPRPNARRRASPIIKPCHPHQKPTEPSAGQRSPVSQMSNRRHPAVRSVQRSHTVQSPGFAFTPGARGAPGRLSRSSRERASARRHRATFLLVLALPSPMASWITVGHKHRRRLGRHRTTPRLTPSRE